MFLNSTLFTFNNKFYKQVFDTPMGSSLSPIIAWLCKIWKKLPFRIYKYIHYFTTDMSITHIVLALPSENIDDTLTIFNSLHTRLQFTIEVGIDNRLNFLDTILIINNKRIIFDTKLYIFGKVPEFSFQSSSLS